MGFVTTQAVFAQLCLKTNVTPYETIIDLDRFRWVYTKRGTAALQVRCMSPIEYSLFQTSCHRRPTDRSIVDGSNMELGI